MSSLSPARRPALGAVALAAALLLTACAGEEPAGGAPDDTDATATTSPGAAPATGAETATGPAGDGDEAAAQGSAEPVESAAVEGPAERTATDGDTTAGDGASAADTAAENPAAEHPAGEDAAEERTDGSAAGSTAQGDGAAAGGSSAGARTGGSPLCSTSQLEVAATPVGGAAGSVHVDVVLTNAGEGPCTLAGYAGVSFVDADGTMIGSPALRDASVPGTGRVVAPGESVAAGLRVSQARNHPTCDARTAAGLRVYPPENTESVVVPFPVEACGDPRIHQLEIQGLGG
ncbi:DUF4232 domain-containing protein [Kocuria sp. NPDC057446]|uniref:DUF4232 domain-containing protein n=1 Tax=Kocuria sp. NPDC057446 TaxID=3346137 RepID=UPI00369E444C